MNRLLLPLLLLAAIGLPIWHVLSPKPWEKNAVPVLTSSNLDGIDGSIPPRKLSNVPISVYSQASFSNPATSFPTTVYKSPAPNSTIPVTPYLPATTVPDGSKTHSMLGSRATPSAPVVSNQAFEKMGGQTFIFSGDAQGPDLSAPPMEFVPITNLADIFRFDISPDWVKRRWKRVSTSPGDFGLGGLRVALVTGTNSNDLHGSLTYYFDANKQLQRITFRGWSGNASKLVNLLIQDFGFETQKTHLAGLYVAKGWTKSTGGLVIKNPVVIHSDNPVQQVAFALEINNPDGVIGLSPSFQAIISESTPLQ